MRNWLASRCFHVAEVASRRRRAVSSSSRRAEFYRIIALTAADVGLAVDNVDAALEDLNNDSADDAQHESDNERTDAS